MKKNRKIAQVEITELAFPNKGIGSFEGKKVIVKNALPGQVLEVSLAKKKGVFQGKTLSVVQKSPMEITALCPHFGLCGGCATQHISYEDELKLKEKMVLKLFEDAEIQGFSYLGIEPSPSETGYRNKMEFSFGDEEKGGKLALGMRKRDSFYEVVTSEHCNIVDEDYRKILLCALDFFKASDDTFYHRTNHLGALRHFIVRKGFFTGDILINVVTTSSLCSDLFPLVQALNQLPLDGKIAGILHTANDSVADVVKSDVTTILFGQDYFYEKLLGLTFKISTFSFFQTNSAGAERLYETVKQFVGDASDKTIFDLYCGTGTIAQIVARNAKAVVGVELVSEAVLAAQENAALNNISNCQFIAGDVLKVVDELPQKPDIIIIDPPREGIHPKAVPKIISFGADKLVYVSCKPTSLVRNLKIFLANGYEISNVRLHDMFGRTAHVECVVLMTKIE